MLEKEAPQRNCKEKVTFGQVFKGSKIVTPKDSRGRPLLVERPASDMAQRRDSVQFSGHCS